MVQSEKRLKGRTIARKARLADLKRRGRAAVRPVQKGYTCPSRRANGSHAVLDVARGERRRARWLLCGEAVPPAGGIESGVLKSGYSRETRFRSLQLLPRCSFEQKEC